MRLADRKGLGSLSRDTCIRKKKRVFVTESIDQEREKSRENSNGLNGIVKKDRPSPPHARER